LYVYTLSGQLYKRQQIVEGETLLPLPKGMYVVVVDGKTWKVKN
jgi:hypothetical protein